MYFNLVDEPNVKQYFVVIALVYSTPGVTAMLLSFFSFFKFNTHALAQWFSNFLQSGRTYDTTNNSGHTLYKNAPECHN